MVEHPKMTISVKEGNLDNLHVDLITYMSTVAQPFLTISTHQPFLLKNTVVY